MDCICSRTACCLSLRIAIVTGPIVVIRAGQLWGYVASWLECGLMVCKTSAYGVPVINRS